MAQTDDGDADALAAWEQQTRDERMAAARVMTAWMQDMTVATREVLAWRFRSDSAPPDDNAVRAALLEEVNSPHPSTNQRIMLAHLADMFSPRGGARRSPPQSVSPTRTGRPRRGA